MTAEAPTPEVVAAWMQNHVCTRGTGSRRGSRRGLPARLNAGRKQLFTAHREIWYNTHILILAR